MKNKNKPFSWKDFFKNIFLDDLGFLKTIWIFVVVPFLIIVVTFLVMVLTVFLVGDYSTVGIYDKVYQECIVLEVYSDNICHELALESVN